MKCPRCGSEQVHMQLAKKRKGLLWLCIILCTISLTLFLGLIGTAIAVIVDIIVLIVAPKHETKGVCQNCGEIFDPEKQTVSLSHSSNVNPNGSSDNLFINRNHSSCGSAVLLGIRVDNMQEVALGTGRSFSVYVPSGEHTLYYRQIGGAKKKKRTGVYQVSVSENSPKKVYMTFVGNGLDIQEQ